jgi:hypothetical protein
MISFHYAKETRCLGAPMFLEDHLSCHFHGIKVHANILISNVPKKDLK